MAFFLCEIKLYRIGDSEPAVKFEIIEQPNGWAKTIKKQNQFLQGQSRKDMIIGWSFWITHSKKQNLPSVLIEGSRPLTIG